MWNSFARVVVIAAGIGTGFQNLNAAASEIACVDEVACDATAADVQAKTALMAALEGTSLGNALDCHGITVNGWTEISFTASTAHPEQLPMGFNYEANEFLVQQNWLRIDKPVDTNAQTPSYGFRIDTILPGSDYRFTMARGLFDSQLTDNGGTPALYGIDPVQFYAEAYFPTLGRGTDVKLGRFLSPYGVESVDTTQTPLASRSYSFIYNPFTHTGVLATTKLNDAWSVWNGLCTGCDVFIDPASSFFYIGGAKWAPPEGKASAEFVTLLGNGRFNVDENMHNPQVFDALLTYQFTEKLKWSGEGIYGFTNNVPAIGFADWYGIVNYLTYQSTDKLSSTFRLEFFDDVEGQRTGTSGLYTAATAGVSYKPWSWLQFRPELRYDHNGNAPFSGDSDLLTADFDVIVLW